MDLTKIQEWVQIYLKHISEIGIETHVIKEEGYKFKAVDNFQRYFDIDALNLAAMLDQAIINNNLVTGAQYWPRKMLIIYAEMFPEETRAILRELFNGDDNVSDRITKAQYDFDNLNNTRNQQLNEEANTYIKLRFLSLLLGYFDSNKYNALKPAEWKIFSRYINPEFAIPKHTPSGEQYAMYSQYIDQLRDYISIRPEIKSIRASLVNGLHFQDEEFRWMAQDVIYITSRIIARMRSEEITYDSGVILENQDDIEENNQSHLEEDNTGFMPLERHLEEYIVKNWDLVDFGEPLTLFRDEDGTTGQQYTTDVGIIDILAKDQNGNFVVIELKRAESGYQVVGQVLNYMGWVQEKLALNSEQVRGIIVVGKANNTLVSALKMVGDQVTVKEYRMKLSLTEPV